MTDARFRFLALAMLAGILVCQVLQLFGIPRASRYVWVSGGSLDVNVENQTLDVEVQNTVAIPVEVKR
jgi:hypothetical protein